jgi:hypothetical protein
MACEAIEFHISLLTYIPFYSKNQKQDIKMKAISQKTKNKRSQAATDQLILIGLVFAIILVVSWYAFKPKEAMEINKADLALSTIAEYSSRAAYLGSGSKLQARIEIPSNIQKISYGIGHINSKILYGGKITDLSKNVNTNVSGFAFSPLGKEVSPGLYSVIFEYIGSGVCIYPPEGRTEHCKCFFDAISRPEFAYINPSGSLWIECSKDGVTFEDCNNLNYGSQIKSLRSKCVNQTGEATIGMVKYSITNWKDETVFEDYTYDFDNNGVYTLNNMDYIVENSDNLDITAVCYDECYPVRGGDKNLTDTAIQSFQIPYGTIVPFILNDDGTKNYDIPDSFYTLIDPSASKRGDLRKGWVQPEEPFMIKVGYECRGGECINVNASLWHMGYPSGE